MVTRQNPSDAENLPKSDGLERHRGLSYLHMPGRSESKKSTFALFKRNLWPPKKWKVPADLTGAPLMMCLHEAAANSNRRKSQ